MMKSKFLYFFLVFILTVQLSFSQKSERIGIIDMEYILSKMEDYTKASEQLEEKITEWKKEVDLKSRFIDNLIDSLEIERPLLTKDLIEDRES
jgi:Skp family chaperone for outer membrane proteins